MSSIKKEGTFLQQQPSNRTFFIHNYCGLLERHINISQKKKLPKQPTPRKCILLAVGLKCVRKVLWWRSVSFEVAAVPVEFNFSHLWFSMNAGKTLMLLFCSTKLRCMRRSCSLPFPHFVQVSTTFPAWGYPELWMTCLWKCSSPGWIWDVATCSSGMCLCP